MKIIEKIKAIKISKTNRKLLSNFISLSLLQGFNYIFPLITLPYLFKVLGSEKFGLIAFAQALIQYFIILTDYGFNMSATRDISIHRDDKEKLSEIYSSVMSIKFFFILFSVFLLSLILFLFPRFREEWLIYYFTFGMVIGQSLFPIWFFQGIEKMKYITFLNTFAKLIFTLSIFIFIKDVSDYIYVPLLNSAGFIVAGIIGIYIVHKKYAIRFFIPRLHTLLDYLKSGWHIFVSSVGIKLYKSASILILGILTNNEIVGYFSIAKKIIDLLNNINVVVSQTFYPHTVKNINQHQYIGVLKKLFFFIFAYAFLIGLALILFSQNIIELLTGEKAAIAVNTLIALSFVPLIIGINIPGVHILLGYKLDYILSRIVLAGGIICIILDFILIPQFSYVGSCVSIIISETFVTVAIYVYLFRRGMIL